MNCQYVEYNNGTEVISLPDSILKKVSQDEKLRNLRESREMAQMEIDWGMKMAEKRGLEQGLEEGDRNASIRIARKMKERGKSFDEISEVTDLSIKEIETL